MSEDARKAVTSITPIIAGLAVGSAFIVMFSTIGTTALSHYYPRYDLGAKDELISKLSEYFGREPANAVKIGNGYYYSLFDGVHDLYAYGLIANYDSKDHGTLRIWTYHNDMKVQAISIDWRTHGEPNLLNAEDLMVSGIADLTIPDWQTKKDNGEHNNRNSQMLNWIHANTKCTDHLIVKNDFSQERKLSLSACTENISVLKVSIES